MSEEKKRENTVPQDEQRRKRNEARKRRQEAREKRVRMMKILGIIVGGLLAVLLVVIAVKSIRGNAAKISQQQSAETGEENSSGAESEADVSGSSTSDSSASGSSSAGTSGGSTASSGADSADASSSAGQTGDGAESGTGTESGSTAGGDSSGTGTETPDTSNAVTVYVTTSDVNIRTEPNTDCAILRTASRGEAFSRIAEENNWSTVLVDGQTAYISSDYLTETEPEKTVWDLASLDPTSYNFGYSSANRDERNVPTDWQYYENRWGEFDVDWIGDTSKNTIYLTMDEGFGNETTIPILNTLEEKNVPVTFFITKMFADERPDLVQAILDHGHQMGNHSCTHPDMTSLSIEEQTAQMMDLNNQIEEQFDYKMKAFRYPMGIYSAQSLGLANNLGFQVTFWSYAYGDYDNDNQPDVAESLQKALDALHPGAIYLLHASSATNAAMLSDFIDGARARGFEFGVYPIHGAN